MSGLSEVRGASLKTHVSTPGFQLPAVSLAAELFVQITCALPPSIPSHCLSVLVFDISFKIRP